MLNNIIYLLQKMKLKIIYSQNIGNLLKKSEYILYFKLFYKLVYKINIYIAEKKADLY